MGSPFGDLAFPFDAVAGLTPCSPNSLTGWLTTPAMTFVVGQISDVTYLFCGPRGIRTLDLLNAIETRSQLRYGPSYSDQLLSIQ